MPKLQKSKRARQIKKEAIAAGLPAGFSHPSHVAGVDRYARHHRHKVYHIRSSGWISWRFAS